MFIAGPVLLTLVATYAVGVVVAPNDIHWPLELIRAVAIGVTITGLESMQSVESHAATKVQLSACIATTAYTAIDALAMKLKGVGATLKVIYVLAVCSAAVVGLAMSIKRFSATAYMTSIAHVLAFVLCVFQEKMMRVRGDREESPDKSTKEVAMPFTLHLTKLRNRVASKASTFVTKF